jgi:2-dehydro-3-deoxyphosphooctonate aldolase (KDO 8-P synthase)
MIEFNELIKKKIFIIGPCVIENDKIMDQICIQLKQIQENHSITIIFKASFDKANRTSITSYRGPGLNEGMKILKEIKYKYHFPITTDIHESFQAELVSDVADIIQIPAFLCRQTDLLIAAAKTGKIVNIKKAQFLAAEDMINPINKVKESGNNKVLLTERGTMFSPGNLVVDFRNIIKMKEFGVPIIMDCTHSVQKPTLGGNTTGGESKYIPFIAKAAKVFGADGFFFETHPEPKKALSDGPNMIKLNELENLIEILK